MSIQEYPWKQWAAQTLAVVGFEMRKFRAGRKWIFPTLLAAAPASLVSLLLLTEPTPPDNAELTMVFAIMVQTFMLRLMILFGCAMVFANLYRGDMVTKTMHYYLLSPVRREVLVAGKYIAGLLITVALYGTSTAVTNILIHFANGPEVANAHFAGPGMGQLLTYVGTAMLGCMGYGSVFMIAGFLFRNPVIPGAVVLLWESINVFLPEVLKKISVVHYLQSITPVPIPLGPFAVLTAPSNPLTSILGLGLFTMAALAISARVMRKAEINYSSD